MAKGKKSLKKKPVKTTALSADTKRSIVAVICFALALISLLSIFNLAGIVGNLLLKIQKTVFGNGFFLAPLGLLLAGIVLLVPHYFSQKKDEKRKHIYAYTFMGILLFIASVLSIFHILGGTQANALRYGGYLGMTLGYPAFRFLGIVGSLVIFAALMIIAVLITFNISFKKKVAGDIKPDSQMPTQPLPLEKSNLWQKVKNITAGVAQKEVKVQQSSDTKDKSSESYAAKETKQATGDSLEAIGSLVKSQANTQANKKAKALKASLPSTDILEGDKGQPTSGDIKANLNIIKRTLENFNIEVEMAEVNVGPTVTQYTLRPAHGVKLAKITALQNDLSLALAAHPIRIEAPIPGRSLVGLEIPNRSVIMVRLKNLLSNPAFKDAPPSLMIALGRNVAGQPVYANLTKMPHLLIAGATGTGKTIALNTLITSLLFQNSPVTMRMIMIDPKRVEFTAYNGIPHLLTPVIVQNNKAVNALRWALGEMDKRFNLLQDIGARDIFSYNSKSNEIMPYIVIVIDELADIMASCGREVEACIVRLAQMARAVGIHLVVATQRPSVEVITGLIKANITTRMAFQVASQIDSRTILDMAGAEKLLGNGDMLYLSAESAKPRRIQGTFISDKEVNKVADYWRQQQESDYNENVIDNSKITLAADGKSLHGSNQADDELYEEAKDVILQAGKASASLLQRRLRVGYARAARLLDILEENGVIGPADGAKPRDVLIADTAASHTNDQINEIDEED